MILSRRALLRLGALASVAGVMPARAGAAKLETVRQTPTDFAAVMAEAEALSKKPWTEQSVSLPAGLRDLTWPQYRDIRFRPEEALWKDEGRGFEAEMYHTGFYFRTPVQVMVVADGRTSRLQFSPDLFDYGALTPPPASTALPFAGFRARHPINRPDAMDEFLVFQGASYFRAVARDQVYGLSARGLALGTAQPDGEEFPDFTRFWLIRPEPAARSIVVLALLESRSTTGAYRFSIRPGPVTTTDVEMVLFPRVDLATPGFAPLTSMYLFGPGQNRARGTDFRDAVHDSSGLQIMTGAGEALWRPLANPGRLQVSAFVDRNPRGFGLAQRARRAEYYGDLEPHYEQRPSVWVEPIGDWGAGAVVLVEIPSGKESNDNIVAFWRPEQPVAAGGPFALTYRMLWCDQPPLPEGVARAVRTRAGTTGQSGRRVFITEFEGVPADQPDPKLEVAASAGTLAAVHARRNPESGFYRCSFELDTGDASVVELRMQLTRDGVPVSETWLYRWTDG